MLGCHCRSLSIIHQHRHITNPPHLFIISDVTAHIYLPIVYIFCPLQFQWGWSVSVERCSTFSVCDGCLAQTSKKKYKYEHRRIVVAATPSSCHCYMLLQFCALKLQSNRNPNLCNINALQYVLYCNFPPPSLCNFRSFLIWSVTH